jgi:hypothetical protein
MNSKTSFLHSNHNSVKYHLSSYLFNNRKRIKIVFKFPLLIVLLISIYVFFKPNIPFILIALGFFMILSISILSTPRKLDFKNTSLKYHIFWQIKYLDIIDISHTKNTVIFKMKNGNNKIIRNVEKQDFDFIRNQLNQK